MTGLIDNLRTLGRTRLLVLAGTGVGIVLAVATMAVLLSRPHMTPLYTGLEPAEAGRIVKAVEAMGVPVSAAFDGTAVQVPEAEVPRLRMLLAEKGLPSRGGIGYELFDTDKPLGITSFMQRMNRLRAMEGELARTIETLSGIEAARVHIVLPDREEFSRAAPTPTASIVVRMRGRSPLERRQALSIRHLVSAAVPNLKPSAVTVLDASGEVLLTEEDGDARSSAKVDGLRAGHETRISRAIEQMLVARLGQGNVRVQVAVDVETKREVVRSQSFDPNSQVVRSTQTVQEQDRSLDSTGEPPVTAEQNLPQREVRAQAQNNRSSSDSKRQEETVNYEISNVARETVIEPGDIRRVSVAVLVNGTWATAQDGTRSYEARSPEELQRITELVRSAMGFSEARGDRVTVDNLEFVNLAPELGAREPMAEIVDTLSRNVMTLIQWVILLVLCGLLIVLGLRPLIRRVFPAPEPVAAEAAAPALAAGAAMPQLTGPAMGGDPAMQAAQLTDAGDPATAALPGIEETMDQLIELRTVEGRVRASSIRRLGDIVDQYPDEAIDILRSWLYEEAV
ncbi:flagellar M-ring protein FliF [Azospirillum brasilense]|uniref:Flagellar M-ring protein n=2 Tax=Azospirillum brasilense TaxID=192 RepID=A0A0N7I914_AZOBR|nr:MULTISPECIES: flagellar basal-body MS-ring/collar protein FliF [Azospirillum]ALJ38819.1 flagellar M-ring protein FliF [Azospirillum brasilense]MDW7557147.1 flagellar basal-body MS-ring/collar protein FliF [Azospirillum brasilense]MDW7596823.1 flagellar basal-body MS-ring/collar protein FliF [Azospirillum brasilense]MDW7631812.1 flagellar basal-body MS-ring/collar protein FliF [Azospirillum brasilense]MDX5950796.1 flagellar basal-body MS-ring/collar protein FliF [Azospirillum brasilense]